MTRETMTPRQRVMTAVAHQEPDRVPLDFYGTAELIASVEDALGLDPDAPEPDFPHFLARHEKLLQAFHIDLRFVEPPYIGPELETFDDGSFMDVWGFRRDVTDYGSGVYYEFLDPRLLEATSVEEVDAYPWPDPDWWDYDSIKLQCERYDRYAIVAGNDGTVDFINRSSFHRGYEQVMLDIALESPVLFAIWRHLSDFFYEFNRRVLEAGEGRIDLMHYGDDYGTQRDTVIGVETYRKLFKPRWRRHMEQARSYGAHIMFHSCGSTRRLLPDLIDTGIEVLTTVQPYAAGMDLRELKRLFGDRLTFDGTVSIQQDLPNQTPADVRRMVRERIEVMAPGGGFILAPTHATQPDTPPENMIAMYDEALEAGWYTT
jgi:uroporphyrinogen decarboxylase